MDHKHTWKRSTRKHGRPPRFFVVCTDPACGEVRQAVMSYGYLHTFTTNHKRGRMAVYSFRLTPDQAADIRRWKKEGWPK